MFTQTSVLAKNKIMAFFSSEVFESYSNINLYEVMKNIAKNIHEQTLLIETDGNTLMYRNDVGLYVIKLTNPANIDIEDFDGSAYDGCISIFNSGTGSINIQNDMISETLQPGEILITDGDHYLKNIFPVIYSYDDLFIKESPGEDIKLIYSSNHIASKTLEINVPSFEIINGYKLFEYNGKSFNLDGVKQILVTSFNDDPSLNIVYVVKVDNNVKVSKEIQSNNSNKNTFTISREFPVNEDSMTIVCSGA